MVVIRNSETGYRDISLNLDGQLSDVNSPIQISLGDLSNSWQARKQCLYSNSNGIWNLLFQRKA